MPFFFTRNEEQFDKTFIAVTSFLLLPRSGTLKQKYFYNPCVKYFYLIELYHFFIPSIISFFLIF